MVTWQQFATEYAARSGVTVDFLALIGQAVAPCACGEDGCNGWQMISQSQIGFLTMTGKARPDEIHALAVADGDG